MKKIAVIPAYNEEKTIERVIKGMKEFVDQIVVVDDGSSDSTYDVAKGTGAVTIRHPENRGYGEALRTGFRKGIEAGGDVIILIDADLQHDPLEAKKLIDHLIRTKSDIVIGSRFLNDRSRIPLYRRFGIKMFTVLTRILIGVKVSDSQSGFRVFTKNAVRKTLGFKTGDMGSSLEMLHLAKKRGLKIREFPITCYYENVRYSVNPLKHGIQLFSILLKLFLNN